jgi:DNA-binding transcriptional ArsR family regulator
VNVENSADAGFAKIAAAIGEPARARMLSSLLSGHARTGTELAMLADVSPSTASVHLSRLTATRLVKVFKQGRHRYYSLEGPRVAAALEGLSVLAGRSRQKFIPSTPSGLRFARTCYDHMAGTLGVSLSDRFQALGWLSAAPRPGDNSFALTRQGSKCFESIGIDIEATRAQRRRFAFACLDWSERRPHVGGALGAAILEVALNGRWVIQDLDSRALELTSFGRRELLSKFGLKW